MAARVVVLDYGSGNLRSAERALRRVGAQVTVSADTDAGMNADGLVVPGVGAYAACMAALATTGSAGCTGTDLVRRRAASGRPVLGVCVGMQVLFTTGEEHGIRTEGIGIFDGAVTRLSAPVLPHMGWNTVEAPDGSALFAGAGHERFYFVHSYAARAARGSVTYAEHGERFVAGVESGAVSATQFHPEKSGDAGSQLLANWLATLT